MSETTKVFVEEEGKEWLKSLLRSGVYTVEFVKKDGSQRKMCCTLMESEIPSEFTPKGTKKTISNDSLSVFDVEVNGWRSFRYDSIVSVQGDF